MESRSQRNSDRLKIQYKFMSPSPYKHTFSATYKKGRRQRKTSLHLLGMP